MRSPTLGTLLLLPLLAAALAPLQAQIHEKPMGIISTDPEQNKPCQHIRQAGQAVAQSILRAETLPRSYMADLTLEALLELGRTSGEQRYTDYALRAVQEQRQLTPATNVPWQRQPFSCLTFAVYEATQDKAWLPVFMKQSLACWKDIWRDAEGITLHPRGQKRGGGQALLIDALQEYCARMARAGSLAETPEQAAAWFSECAQQFRFYRGIVRYPDSGLWSQGRGWLGDRPQELSPGAWSRGHGWLIRGMEQSLRYLPRDSAEYREVRGYLIELVDSLIAVQSPDGMWRCLLTRPADQSPPETSGTAMIAYHIARALKDGHLTSEKHRAAANKALAALPRYVLQNGTVLNTSPGPGPLETEEPWLKSAYPASDPHGVFSLLFAAAADHLLHP